MLSRWQTLPPYKRLWILSGVVWFPIIILTIGLALVISDAHAFKFIWLSLLCTGLVVSGTLYVLGVIRMVQVMKAKRLEDGLRL
jgi:hypothetical protein